MSNFLAHLWLQKICPTTLLPTQKMIHGFSTLKSQGIVLILISFQMISKALQTELFSIKIDSLGWPIPRIRPYDGGNFSVDIFQIFSNFKIALEINNWNRLTFIFTWFLSHVIYLTCSGIGCHEYTHEFFLDAMTVILLVDFRGDL